MAGKDETKKVGCVEKKDDSKSGKGKKIKGSREKKKERSRDDASASWEECPKGKDKGCFPC